MAMNATKESEKYSFSSFSGVDIKAVFHGEIIGEIQQLSYQVQREIAPIYTMGSKYPRAYGHGKEAIAGTLVFTMIDKNALLFAMRKAALKHKELQPWVDREDAMPEAFRGKNTGAEAQAYIKASTAQNFTSSGVVRADSATYTSGIPGDPNTGGVFVGEDDIPADNIRGDQLQALPYAVTDILPFTISLVSSNEYGKSSIMKLHGVKILSETYSISIDNVTSDQAFQFMALSLDTWTSVE